MSNKPGHRELGAAKSYPDQCQPTSRAIAANRFDGATKKPDQTDGHVDVHEKLAPGLVGADGEKPAMPSANPNQIGIRAVVLTPV